MFFARSEVPSDARLISGEVIARAPRCRTEGLGRPWQISRVYHEAAARRHPATQGVIGPVRCRMFSCFLLPRSGGRDAIDKSGDPARLRSTRESHHCLSKVPQQFDVV